MNDSAQRIDLPRPIRRVAFTCDFLRFGVVPHGYASLQTRNLMWLFTILTAGQPWRRPDLALEQVLPPPDAAEFERALANPEALAEYRDDAEQAWARRHDAAEPDLFPALFESLSTFDLVIGFELPPTLKRHLHRLGRAYLSFHIHPLRFLPDLCLGVTTNCPAVAAVLEPAYVATSAVEVQVRRFRAMFLRRKPEACAIPPGLPLLIGQTERDSVLIENKSFFGWSDADEPLARTLSGNHEIVFLEHPYRPSSRMILHHLRSVHNKTVIGLNANAYGVLFSNPDIPRVVTLASSLGVEASAMGLATEFLLGSPESRLRVAGIDVPTNGACGHRVLTDSLWRQILQDQAGTDDHPRDDFFRGENFLRNSLESWAYRPLQYGFDRLVARKVLLPAARLSVGRCSEITAALFGREGSISECDAASLSALTGVSLVTCDAPLQMGQALEVRLGSPAAGFYLAEGFSAPENWGCWSDALKSRLSIVVDPAVVDAAAQVRVTLRLSVHDAVLRRSPVLRITATNRVCGYAFFRSTWPQPQEISFVVKPDAPVLDIDFEFSDIEMPLVESAKPDSRLLGFALTRLHLECVPVGDSEPALQAASSFQVWGLEPRPATVLEVVSRTRPAYRGYSPAACDATLA